MSAVSFSLNAFSPAVRAALEALLVQPLPGACAAFDADGTVWDHDINEALFKELSAAGGLPRHKNHDAYAEYLRRVATDKRDAYTWAVQAMADMKEQEVLAWSG